MRDDIPGKLRERNLRATPQRRAILAALEADGGHLTADEVYERARGELPELARATVYNTLEEFLRVGLVQPLGRPGAVRYETNVEPHEHFRCVTCERVYDVYPPRDDWHGLAGEGFVVERSHTVFEGTCPDCVALERDAGGQPGSPAAT